MGILLPFCSKALNSVKKFVWTMWFLDLPILVHNPGYVDLIQQGIFESEEFVSSEISFTD